MEEAYIYCLPNSHPDTLPYLTYTFGYFYIAPCLDALVRDCKAIIHHPLISQEGCFASTIGDQDAL